MSSRLPGAPPLEPPDEAYPYTSPFFVLMTRKEYANDQEQAAQYPRDDRDAGSYAVYVGKRAKNEPVKWHERD